MNGLLHSRKFWIAVLDVAISTVTYFVTKLVAPEIGDSVLFVIGAWQPVIVMVIYGITAEDVAAKNNPDYRS